MEDVKTASQYQEFVSVGIHPWHIPENHEKALARLRKYAENSCVMAIGECGLDALRGGNADLQEEIFIKQIRIAEEVGKPLIVHCVRAYHRLQQIMESVKPAIPWIVHGFNHNELVGLGLIRHGAYLSIGKDLARDISRVRKSVKLFPVDRLFLESDESKIPVSVLYDELASILQVDLYTLQHIMQVNLKKCIIL
jgi:TatD DNase family protein